jgi:hypothetical protein
MARAGRFRGGVRVTSDFVEADLDTVFALLYMAETQPSLEGGRVARRALEEAEAACRDARLRLRGLAGEDVLLFAPRLERLLGVIGAMKKRLRAG